MYEQGLNFFSPIMKKIFPFYYVGNELTYHFNAVMRYMIIKTYGDDFINKINPSIKSFINNYYPNSDNTLQKCVEPEDLSEINLIVTQVPIENIALNSDFTELNSNTYPINTFIKGKTKIPTRVFINKTDKKVIIATHTKSDVLPKIWWCSFLACTPQIFQWVFDKKLTNTELELFKAFSDCDLERATASLNQLTPEISEKQYYRKALLNYKKHFKDNEIEKLKEETRTLRQEINEYEECINDRLDKLSTANLKIMGLEQITSDDTTLIDFFDSHNNLSIHDIQNNYDSKIYYVVDEILEYYDSDEFSQICNTIDSYMSRVDKKIKTVLYEMFVNNKGHFITRAAFKVNNLSSIEVIGKDYLPYIDYTNVLPHPHLAWYRCLGGNRNEIDTYLFNGEWDLAIEQTIAATKNLNFGDYTVMRHLISYLEYEPNTKFILADNGSRMSVNEFADYIGYNKEENNG